MNIQSLTKSEMKIINPTEFLKNNLDVENDY